jgi:hypothetical protein
MESTCPSGPWAEDSHDGSIICFISKIMLWKSLREPGRTMVLACDRMRLRPRCVLLPQVFESERTYHSVKSEGVTRRKAMVRRRRQRWRLVAEAVGGGRQ